MFSVFFPVFVPNFGSMIPLSIDWFRIVRSCDEAKLPRCSWAHFINLAQPLQINRELLENSGTAAGVSTEHVIIPYLHGDCWPIRSVEQASLIYIYAVCTVYWNVTGFDRHVSVKFKVAPPQALPNVTSRFSWGILSRSKGSLLLLSDLSPALRSETLLHSAIRQSRLLSRPGHPRTRIHVRVLRRKSWSFYLQ